MSQLQIKNSDAISDAIPKDKLKESDPDFQHILVHSDRSADRLRSLKYGDTFAVFDHYGDIRPAPTSEEGLYFDGTRFLSSLILELDGLRPLMLGSTVRDDNDQLVVTLTNPDLFVDGEIHLPANAIHISRRTFLLDTVCYVEIRLENYSFAPIDTTLTIKFAADYKDIYEVRGMSRESRGKDFAPELKEDQVRLSYLGLDSEHRITEVRFTPRPNQVTESCAQFKISLLPRKSLTVQTTIVCMRSLRLQAPPLEPEEARARNVEEISNEKANACSLQSSNGQFNAWVNRSLSDLHMMVTLLPTGPYPYAGVPWFNTPFGRDGIITAWECLWMRPDIARGVLQYLAKTQAVEVIPEQDAEPGKILHETRSGEMATLKEMPFGLYYGSVDATPLFVALAGAYYERTGDKALIEDLWPNLCAALQWMATYGDKDGDGFLEYERSSFDGLIHQGWKDADDAVFHADGTPVQGAIAMCEVQGYAYAAYKAASMLAALLGDEDEAARLTHKADLLYERFNEAFWCEDLSTYAIALDGQKQRCCVISSNAGQCLFTGIATQERAQRLAQTLLSPSSYSGWGIRTIASSEPRFNPMAYHNGSIWPHDNALIAYGMARYGLTQEANIVFNGLFEAAMYFDLHRMPELFCGFSKEAGEGPVLYPVACAPQAWAAASMFLLFQASLGLRVDGIRKRVTLVRPALPGFLNEIHIANLQVGDSSLDLDVIRHGSDVGITVKNTTNQLAVLLMK
ncbi:glycogen debranching N-terminal domain-containing protein [Granulicella sp. dw_53]|uniref:amylo-alpha-1,6-glucosidase n=1 Tax=Granulicella sp. dw_53 TaxID=2719792 RepID=UPI001BD2AE28|nr:glycogen debranching N-terminal domain-containing protein [Granulicella sp. dw_53]